MLLTASRNISFLFLLLFLFFFISCDSSSKDSGSVDFDTVNTLDAIKKRGKLIVITDFNSVDYFIYKGQPLGFNYELIKKFAEHIGVSLEIRTNYNLKNTFRSLQDDECDILAMGLTITKERTEFLQFTLPIMQTKQVLVQRKPEDWQKMDRRKLESQLIRSTLELANKHIVVEANSSYCDRLSSLSQEIGDTIRYLGSSEFLTEDLIQQVAEGRINFTVSDQHIALVAQTYYPNIDIATPISFEQNLAWAVKKGSNQLLDTINGWLKDYKASKQYVFLYAKYFKSSRRKEIAKSEYNSFTGGKISVYDKFLKEQSVIVGWDWRLIASLMYSESRFNPKAKSWAGAFGLMQLMPVTANKYGVGEESSPQSQIIAGIKYLKWLDKYFSKEIPDSTERINFVLASYNAGAGHVEDARALAKKYGKDPNVWFDNVDYFILQKSKPEFYKDAVVKYGYLRGAEPYRYVSEIVDRYNNYKNLIKA
ncbi:MAG: lytic transglycosylase F [Bacteroidetes bacterium]|nr:MAG: lytic transglycosylase F [Bacteroidota bacterium]